MEAADFIRTSSLSVAARAVLVEQVCDELDAAAVAAGVPIVLLKGAALLAGGHISAGSRAMADVDFLVDEENAAQLESELVNRGFALGEPLGSDHDLLLAIHSNGIPVEGHRWIPGLTLDEGIPATASELIRRGFCLDWRPGSEHCLLPNRHVLMAHALAHGIAQHGLAPDKYPILRMLADLQDLAPTDAEWQVFRDCAMGWTNASSTRTEVTAVRGLERRLHAGEDPTGIADEQGFEGLLLRHAIAGTRCESYRLAIRARHRLTGASGSFAVTRAWNVLRHGLFLSRAQIDHIYGPPRSAIGYWGWRLWRPLEMCYRLCSYGWANLRHRRRQ
jgi:hypothetical protein